MKQTDRVKFCNSCKNQKYSYEEGTICGLTNKRADFESECPNFEDDGTFAKKLSRFDFWIILFMIQAAVFCLTSAQNILKLDFSAVGIGHIYGIAFYAFLTILSAYIIYALLTKRRSVIYWCITLPAINILVSIFAVIQGLINLDVINALIDCLPAFVVNTLWILYFLRSEYIRRTYKPFEVDYKKDKRILIAIIVVLFLLKIVQYVIQ